MCQSNNIENSTAKECLRRLRSEVQELSKSWALFEAMNSEDACSKNGAAEACYILKLSAPLNHLRHCLFRDCVLTIFRLSDPPLKRHTFCTLSKILNETNIENFWKGRLDLDDHLETLESYKKEYLSYFPSTKWGDHDGEKFFKTFREKHKHTRHGYLAHTGNEGEYRMPSIEDIENALNTMIKLIKHGCFIIDQSVPPYEETINTCKEEAARMWGYFECGLRQSTNQASMGFVSDKDQNR
ncbi:MAG: hypothetical protein DHS20C08_02040 [Rhodomicrobium sp.]|nr:MAG: hypothetical protein DHS20C08_02040 [Rhodomicrobium sp.]